MISIVIPIHNMANKDFFLKRCLDSVEKQTFKDYEIVVVEEGKFAENTNVGIRKARGDLIKFLLMDDYFYDENSLQQIADNFKSGWMITGCVHDDGILHAPHMPHWSPLIIQGGNSIGSPSVLTIENKEPLFFDESLSWLVDCDYYKRLYDRYGEPTILNKMNVIIGIHEGQMTHLISDEIKHKELLMMKEKYA